MTMFEAKRGERGGDGEEVEVERRAGGERGGCRPERDSPLCLTFMTYF